MNKRLLLSVASLAAIFLAIAQAPAATITKANNTDALNLTTSWSGGVVPGAGDVAQWNSTVTGANTVSLGANLSWGGISLVSPGGAVAINAGNTLTLGSSGIDMSAATQNLSIGTLALGAGQTWNVATGKTLTVTTLTRNAGASLVIDRSANAGTVTASPTLVNSVVPWAIVKSGGTAGNNSTNGYTFATVTSGSVSAYATATLTTFSGTLGTATVNYDVNGTGNSSTRGVALTGNTVRNVATSAATLLFSTGSLTVNALMNAGTGALTIGGAVGQGSLIAGTTGELVLAAANDTIVINSPISGASSGVTVIGPSTVTLAGANTYTGATSVFSGTLSVAADNNLGAAPGAATAGHLSVSGGTLAVTTGFTLNSNRGLALSGSSTINVASGQTLSYGGIAAGVGSLTKSGTGVLTLSGANTYSGGTTISGGTLSLGSAGALGSSGTIIFGGGTLQYSASNTTDYSSRFSTAASQAISIDTGGQSISFASALTSSGGSLTKSGTGALTLSGANTYSAGTTLSLGQLNLNSTTALGTGAFTISGGTIDNTSAGALTLANNNAQNWNGDFTFSGTQSLNLGTGAVAMNASRSVTVSANQLTVGGAIGGVGFNLTKAGAGTLVLNGANTYTGQTSLNAGTLVLGNASAVSSSSKVQFPSTGTPTIVFATDTSTTFTLGMSSGSGGSILADRATPGAAIDRTIATSGGLGGGTINFGQGANVTSGTSRITLSTIAMAAGTVQTTVLNPTNVSLTLPGDVKKTSSNVSQTLELSGTTPDNQVTGNISNGTPLTGGNAISITKSGSSVWTLSGNNTYTGGTTLSAGQLNLNSTTALGTGAFTISGGTTIDNTSAGALTLANNNAQNWNGDFTFAGTQNLNLGTGAVTMNASRSVTVSANQLTVGGIIAGVGFGVVKSGAGALALSGNNSYSGGTTLSAGTLLGGHSSAFGSGSLTLNGGTIASSSGTAYTFANALTIGGNVTIGQSSVGTGALTFSGTTDLGSSTRTLEVLQEATLGGIVGGTGGLTKSGAGTLTLSANNTFSGALEVQNGKVAFSTVNNAGSAGPLGQNSGAIVLGSSGNTGSLHYLGSTASSDRTLSLASGGSGSVGVSNSTTALTLSGLISGSGNFDKRGTGTLVLSGNNTFGGSLTVADGILSFGTFNNAGASGPLGTSTSAIVLGNSGNTATLLYTGATASSDRKVTMGSGATSVIEVSGSTTGLTLSGLVDGSGAFQKTGSGTLTLSGNNSYSGGTTIAAGALRLDSATAAGSGTITQTSGSSLLQINTTDTVANTMSIYNIATLQSVTLSGNQTLHNATFNVSEGTTTINSGNLDGEGGVTKTGTGSLTLTGSNTYTGNVDVQAGVLELASTGGAQAAGSTGAVSVSSGATLLISTSNQVNDSAAVTLSGGTILLGSGVSEKFAGLTLTGASTLDFGTGTSGTMWFAGAYAPDTYKLTLSNLSAGEIWKINQNLTTTIPIMTYASGTVDFDSSFSITSSGGFTSGWDGTSFTITAIPEPSTYAAAVGLLALFAWPFARRPLRR